MDETAARLGQGRAVLPGRGAKRRQLIIDATLEVIAEHGVRGLSHRRVAKAAGVPLSATSYYFETLETLLEAAFLDALERNCDEFSARLGKVPAGGDPIPELAAILHELMAEPQTAVLTYELLVAAIPNERLRSLAHLWAHNWEQAMRPFMADDEMTTLAGALTGGLLQQGIMIDPPMPAKEIEALLRRGLYSR